MQASLGEPRLDRFSFNNRSDGKSWGAEAGWVVGIRWKRVPMGSSCFVGQPVGSLARVLSRGGVIRKPGQLFTWDMPAQLPLPCCEILGPSEVRPRVAPPMFEGLENLRAGDLAPGPQSEVRLILKGQRSWREGPGGWACLSASAAPSCGTR